MSVKTEQATYWEVALLDQEGMALVEHYSNAKTREGAIAEFKRAYSVDHIQQAYSLPDDVEPTFRVAAITGYWLTFGMAKAKGRGHILISHYSEAATRNEAFHAAIDATDHLLSHRCVTTVFTIVVSREVYEEELPFQTAYYAKNPPSSSHKS